MRKFSKGSNDLKFSRRVSLKVCQVGAFKYRGIYNAVMDRRISKPRLHNMYTYQWRTDPTLCRGRRQGPIGHPQQRKRRPGPLSINIGPGQPHAAYSHDHEHKLYSELPPRILLAPVRFAASESLPAPPHSRSELAVGGRCRQWRWRRGSRAWRRSS